MRKISFSAIIATSLLVSACGSEESGTFESEDGELSHITGGGLDVELPPGFTVYPGANVVSNLDQGQTDGGLAINMESDAPVEDLLSHYRNQAVNAGVEIRVDMTIKGRETLAGEGAGGGSFALSIAEGDDGTNELLLIFGEELR